MRALDAFVLWSIRVGWSHRIGAAIAFVGGFWAGVAVALAVVGR